MIKTVAMILLCAALAMPVAEAQNNRGRGRSGGNTHQPASPQSRPGAPSQGAHNSGGRPGGQTPANRPGNHNNGNHNGNRPGASTPGSRPGNMGRPPGQNYNPGRPDNRPGSGRPGGNYVPGPPQGHRPPGGGPGYHPGGGPSRPHMPPPRPFYRPAPPPPAWRPAPGWRPFTTILGVTFGTALNLSLNTLVNQGYAVSSYGNDVIHLNNVQMAGYWWPDATLYFNPGGGLYASRFMNVSQVYDMSRYNMVYATLLRNYGSPVSVTNLQGGIESVWWGTGNQFIRLSYQSDYSAAGYPIYLTTLSYGN